MLAPLSLKKATELKSGSGNVVRLSIIMLMELGYLSESSARVMSAPLS
jgi:hypothetical protein